MIASREHVCVGKGEANREEIAEDQARKQGCVE